MYSLYNREIKIQELMREAHPSGGLDVLNAPTPSGGDTVVEDNIEHQLAMLRLVYKQPIGRVVARLAQNLEKEGAIKLAEKVRKVADPVEDAMRARQRRIEEGRDQGRVSADPVPQFSDERMQFFQERVNQALTAVDLALGASGQSAKTQEYSWNSNLEDLRGYYTGTNPISGKPRPKLLSKERWKRVLMEIINGKGGEDYYPPLQQTAAKFLGQDFGAELDVEQLKQDQGGVGRRDLTRAIDEGKDKAKSRVESGKLIQEYQNSVQLFHRQLKELHDRVQTGRPSAPQSLRDMFTEGYNSYMSNAAPLLERTNVEGDKALLKEYPKYTNQMRRALMTATRGYPAYEADAQKLLGMMDTFAGLPASRNPTQDLQNINQVKQLGGEPTIEVPTPEGAVEPPPATPDAPPGTPQPGESKRESPLGTATPAPTGGGPRVLSEDNLKKLQAEKLGVEATGTYDKATHDALGKWLSDRRGQDTDEGEVAKHLWGNLYKADQTATSRNLADIFDYIYGFQSVRGAETKAPRRTTRVKFTTPDGATVDFPLSLVITRGQKNPFYLLRALQGRGALPLEASDEELLKGNALPQVIKAIGDALIESDGERVAGNIMNVLDRMVFKMQDMLETKDKGVTTMQWVNQVFPLWGPKVETNPEAVRILNGFMANKGYSTPEGYINPAKARANKLTIRGLVAKVIKMFGLEGAKPAKPKQVDTANIRKLQDGTAKMLLRREQQGADQKKLWNILNNFIRHNYPIARDKYGYTGSEKQFRDAILQQYKALRQQMQQLPQKKPHPAVEKIRSLPQTPKHDFKELAKNIRAPGQGEPTSPQVGVSKPVTTQRKGPKSQDPRYGPQEDIGR